MAFGGSGELVGGWGLGELLGGLPGELVGIGGDVAALLVFFTVLASGGGFKAVCRQSISDSWLGNLRECLAHLV